MSGALACEAVSVDYGAVRAVRRLDLAVADGATVVVLGPSGSGKSTLMFAVAGFRDVSEGTITLAGRVVSTPRQRVPPEQRPVGLVFQSYALWPHLSAEDTVAYPLRRSGLDKRAARVEARALLDTLDIGDLAHRKPAELSGGQQQRVGLARALARRARLYLLDEPTAHLDSSIRARVQEEIGRRRRETGAAALYATHDAEEALALADRVVILREGSAIQAGTPQEVYERPVDVWAARLTGPASLFTVPAEPAGPEEVIADLAGRRVAAAAARPGRGPVAMLVRPEWVSLDGPADAVVEEVWYRGSYTDYRLATPAGPLDARLPGPPRARRGEPTGWTVERGWVAAAPERPEPAGIVG